MRKRTGLHNRGRKGKSTYSAKRKRLTADRYGSWAGGRQTGGEVIAGRSVWWRLVA
jgi:hypothetical protein